MNSGLNPHKQLGKTAFGSPKQQEEPIDFQNDPNDGPPHQNHQHASEKETGGLDFVPLEEKHEGPLQADDKRQTKDEKNLCKEKKRALVRTKVGDVVQVFLIE